MQRDPEPIRRDTLFLSETNRHVTRWSTPHACFPALGTLCVVSRAWRPLHVFPRLVLVTCFGVWFPSLVQITCQPRPQGLFSSRPGLGSKVISIPALCSGCMFLLRALIGPFQFFLIFVIALQSSRNKTAALNLYEFALF